jgi:tetratricopeptide (TPR) repeat protein
LVQFTHWLFRHPPSFLFFVLLALADEIPIPAQPPTIVPSHPAIKKTAAINPETFNKLRQEADQAREKGDLAEAVRLYNQLVKMRPGWAEGWWYLGSIHYDSDQYAAAASASEKCVAHDAQNPQAWGLLGLCEYRLARNANALEHLTKSRQLGLDRIPEISRVVRLNQAMLLNRSRQYEAAHAVLKTFAVEHQEANSVLDAMGMAILRNSGSVEKLSPEDRLMIREFGQAVFLEGEQKMEEAGQLYGQLEAKYPGKPNVAYACGMNRLLRNRYEEAEKYFKIELERDPRHVAVLLQLTFCSISTSQWEEGYRYAKMATDLAPANGLRYYFLGRIHLRRNEFAQAAAMLEKAARLEPETPNIQYSLSQAYSRMNRPQAAARAQAEYERLETLHKQRSGMIFDPRSENPPSSPANQDSRKDATP